VERLSPLDSFFLFIEDGITHMHIASCAVFEGPAPRYEEVSAAIGDKLGSVPRYRQLVRFVPLQLGRPVWVDDPHFHLEYHLRHTALPPPGGDGELSALMGRLMSQELDRHRPLWEAWMVEGLDDGRWALVTKIHHCMVDGISGTDLFAVILDPERDTPRVRPLPWRPQPGPSAIRLAVDAAWHLAAVPYEALRAIGEIATTAPGRALSQLRDVAAGWASYAQRIPPPATSSLVGTIGPHRRWTWANAPLDDVKAIRRSLGGTVNDVIVAAVTGGLRELLLSRGESTDGLVVRALIPVSVRAEDERGAFNNRVSAMFADLPVAIEDPAERFAAVREQMGALKSSHQTVAGESLTTLGELTPSAALAFAERATMQILRRVPQQTMNTVVTNVPGPQFPLYLAGREMLEFLPFVPITYGMRVGVAIVSYNGKLGFGVTGDYDAAPDVGVLARGIEDAIAELLKATG
jgi:diacylglycerol O-acyltransferase / wax synthase